jgi:hypothetical protein
MRCGILVLRSYLPVQAVSTSAQRIVGRFTETVAAKTDHSAYWMLFVGMAIPGIGTLAFIPAYIRIALRQTSGLIDPAEA